MVVFWIDSVDLSSILRFYEILDNRLTNTVLTCRCPVDCHALGLKEQADGFSSYQSHSSHVLTDYPEVHLALVAPLGPDDNAKSRTFLLSIEAKK